MTGFDAAILAGGSARRLGGVDKALVEVGGAVLLERVVASVAVAERIVCVGPVRETEAAVIWCREDPPGGGPVAALAAALPYVRADVVVVLAVDLPFVDGATVSTLVAAARSGDGAIGVDRTGRRQPLLAAYRRSALQVRLGAIGQVGGARMRDLVEGLAMLDVEVGAAATDCDTPEDVAAARARRSGEPSMSTLDDWVRVLSDDLGVELAVDIKSLLDLARDAAHGVDRPAAPLTTFLVGYAAAQAGGGPDAVAAEVGRAVALARQWAADHTGDVGLAPTS